MKREIKETIASIGKRLYERRLNGGYGGNISIKDEGMIYITPSGLPKDILLYSDIIVVDFKGNLLEGEGKPSSELLFHVAIYKERSDVNAIVHTHPPVSTGFAIANMPLQKAIHEEVSLILGEVPVLPYEMTSSKELARSVANAFKKYNAVMLANHGVITVGDTPEKAFRRAEELENICISTLVANTFGGAKEIPADKLKALFSMFYKKK